LLASNRAPDEVIVVDNSASAGGRAICSEGLGGPVRYLPASRNLGFSGGMNLGIRDALERGSHFVLLVNSDAAVSPACIGTLEQALLDRPHDGIAGPRIQSSRSPGETISLGLRYAPSLGRMRDRAADGAGADAEDGIERVDAVTGCVMLVRREVFQSIGLFDEDYFFSFEDLDFCLKAARAGYASVVVRSAAALHDGSRSIGPQSTRRLYFAARNHLLLGRRMAPTSGRVAAASRFASIVALNAAHAATADGGTLAERLGAVWAGTRDYLAGRYGNG
jgi:GT2 family glycosyltransferase